MSPFVPQNVIEPGPSKITTPKTSRAAQVMKSTAMQRLPVETVEGQRSMENGSLPTVVARIQLVSQICIERLWLDLAPERGV